MKRSIFYLLALLCWVPGFCADSTYKWEYTSANTIINNTVPRTVTLEGITWDLESNFDASKGSSWLGLQVGISKATDPVSFTISHGETFKGKYIKSVKFGTGLKSNGGKYSLSINGVKVTEGDIAASTNTPEKKQMVSWTGELLCEGGITIGCSSNVAKQAVYVGPIEIVYGDAGGSDPQLPDKVETPIFSLNGKGLLPQELADVKGYAGNIVSIACPTADSKIDWSVSVNGGDATVIGESDYTIATDAAPGSVFKFVAKAYVEAGDKRVTSEQTELSLTLQASPDYGFFYTPALKEVPGFGTLLMNASGQAGGSNNTKTKALCAVEGGFNSGIVNLVFDNTKGNNFAYINKDQTISMYKKNEMTISLSDTTRILDKITFDAFNESFTADSGNFAEGVWTSPEGVSVSQVVFTYDADAASNWTSKCISTIRVDYKEKTGSVGIEETLAEGLAKTPVYYNLQGQRVSVPVKGTIYIRLMGEKAEKIIY